MAQSDSMRIVTELYQHKAQLWAEARVIKEKALTYLAIISSGAIIVSVNAIGPLMALVGGRPLALWVLITSWVLLLVAIVATVKYRFLVSADIRQAARDMEWHDMVRATPPAPEKRAPYQRRLRFWRRLTWCAFLGGLCLLLLFLVLNLCSAKPVQSPPEKPAGARTTTRGAV